MSPVRNASKALADVMQRSERRGAAQEQARLMSRAQDLHASQHSAPGLDFRECRHPACTALKRVLGTDQD